MAFGSCLYSMLAAQYTTDMIVGQQREAMEDSMKKVVYPYLLPIWGEKVTRKGFLLPKSAGLSAQYIWQTSDIIIENLQVGFNNGQLFNLDQIVRFDKSTATTGGVNIRPDIWLFPFLMSMLFLQSQILLQLLMPVFGCRTVVLGIKSPVFQPRPILMQQPLALDLLQL